MLSQDRIRNRREQFFRKNRKGVSIMVGYVLLVVFAVVLSVVVYQWIKTYVPGESLQCSDGVSVFVKEVSYDCSNNQFNITIKNNGRFSILGYFIHAANESAQEIATIDLSQYINDSFEGQKFGNSIAFTLAQTNSFSPSDEKKVVFNLPTEINELKLLQIIPTRLQEIDNKNRFVSCGDAKIKETIVCGVTTGVPPPTSCTPDCGTSVCGFDPMCGTLDCGSCTGDTFCDASGQCISTSCTPAADPCGTFDCGNVVNGTCGTANCGSCSAGFSCVSNSCVSANKFVFVSSGNFNGNLGGLSGADATCNSLASTAGLTGRTFVAWLSDGTTNAGDKILDAAYFLVDGTTKVADSKTDLLDGSLDNAINTDENGLDISVENKKVWTGTDEFGQAQEDTCSNWNSDSGGGGQKGLSGRSTQTNDDWTNELDNSNCNQNLGLYCFQI